MRELEIKEVFIRAREEMVLVQREVLAEKRAYFRNYYALHYITHLSEYRKIWQTYRQTHPHRVNIAGKRRDIIAAWISADVTAAIKQCISHPGKKSGRRAQWS